MQITITAAQLKEIEACDEAIAVFREQFGDSVTADWTRDKQIEILKSPIGKHLGWAYRNGLIPWWDLSGAYLSGADLSRANLSRADLSRAYLSGADLSGANLSRADLSRANLSRAYLSGADLSGADLSGANLSGADLSVADLSGANLSGAYLSGADLSGANLSRAYLSGANLSRANLSGADLSGAYLSGANLSGGDLSGADLSGANLSRAYLSRANLSWANLSRADLSRADLSGAIPNSLYAELFASFGWTINEGCLEKTGNTESDKPTLTTGYEIMRTEPLLYLARCSECGSIVAAATPHVMHVEPQTAAEWLRDGLDIERSDTAVELRGHASTCRWAPARSGKSATC